MQEPLKHRIIRIARGESLDIATRFALEDGATGGIPRRFAH